jgi:hypothetical protein
MNRQARINAERELTMNTELATSENSSATERSRSKQKPSRKKVKATKTAMVAAKATSKVTQRNSKKAKSPEEGRGDTKKAIVLELLRRKEGATIAKIAKATDWQNHSIRGFISGTVAKKLGLVVESVKNEAGERNYRITS